MIRSYVKTAAVSADFSALSETIGKELKELNEKVELHNRSNKSLNHAHADMFLRARRPGEGKNTGVAFCIGFWVKQNDLSADMKKEQDFGSSKRLSSRGG